MTNKPSDIWDKPSETVKTALTDKTMPDEVWCAPDGTTIHVGISGIPLEDAGLTKYIRSDIAEAKNQSLIEALEEAKVQFENLATDFVYGRKEVAIDWHAVATETLNTINKALSTQPEDKELWLRNLCISIAVLVTHSVIAVVGSLKLSLTLNALQPKETKMYKAVIKIDGVDTGSFAFHPDPNEARIEGSHAFMAYFEQFVNRPHMKSIELRIERDETDT